MSDAPVVVDMELMKRLARLFVPFSDRAVRRVYRVLPGGMREFHARGRVS